MSPTYVFDRKTGPGWPEPVNPSPRLDAYKLSVPSEPRRGPNAHEPVEMLEVFSHCWLSVWQCPICRQGYELRKDELPKGFVGVDCAGDAMRESVEDANE